MWLCVTTAVEKEEMLLNRAPGNPNYCLRCSALSNLLCGAWDFALFGGTHSSSADGWAFPLNPLKENFILESFLYFYFSIYFF